MTSGTIVEGVGEYLKVEELPNRRRAPIRSRATSLAPTDIIPCLCAFVINTTSSSASIKAIPRNTTGTRDHVSSSYHLDPFNMANRYQAHP